jgi:hypothetical protein
MQDNTGTVEITIRVPQQTVAELQAILQTNDSSAQTAFSCQPFAELAFQLYFGWLSGKRRHRTLTEQYIDWIESIYTALLPPNESPSVYRLYNRFNIPYGQATYICRILNEKGLPQRRKRALRELVEVLQAKQPKAAEFIDIRGEPERTLVIKLSSLASIELRNITLSIFQVDRSIIPPKSDANYGEIRTVSIPAITLIQVLDRLNKTLDHEDH